MLLGGVPPRHQHRCRSGCPPHWPTGCQRRRSIALLPALAAKAGARPHLANAIKNTRKPRSIAQQARHSTHLRCWRRRRPRGRSPALGAPQLTLTRPMPRKHGQPRASKSQMLMPSTPKFHGSTRPCLGLQAGQPLVMEARFEEPCSSMGRTRPHRLQNTCRGRRCFWRPLRTLPQCFASGRRSQLET